MHLENYRQSYYFNSGKASDIIRYLGLAGLALIWMLRIEIEGNKTIPDELILPAILLINGLFFDLLQYFVASILWAVFCRQAELRGVQEDDTVKAPRWINWPAITFFYGKFILVITALCIIVNYLYNIL